MTFKIISVISCFTSYKPWQILVFTLGRSGSCAVVCRIVKDINLLTNAISYAHTGNCKCARKSSNSCAKCYETSDVLKTPCRQNRLDAVCLNAIPGSGVCGDSANALAYVYHIYWVTSTAKWFYRLQKNTCLGFKHIEGTHMHPHTKRKIDRVYKWTEPLK